MKMNRKKWTKAEDELLIKEFPTKTNKELSEMFNRSEKSIIQHAHTLKLYKNKQMLWEDHEIEFLNKHYNVDMTTSDIAKKLNRSASSVKSKAFAIGLADNVEWTQEQIDYLTEQLNYHSRKYYVEITELGYNILFRRLELLALNLVPVIKVLIYLPELLLRHVYHKIALAFHAVIL